MNVNQELKKIAKEQKKTSRNVQFLINGGIIFTSLYKINEYNNKLVKILSLITVGLAVFSQMVLMIEDLKEEWNAPDEDNTEEGDEE